MDLATDAAPLRRQRPQHTSPPHAFDTWMDREFPGCPFERYADDVVAHCDTEDQARELQAAIAEQCRVVKGRGGLVKEDRASAWRS